MAITALLLLVRVATALKTEPELPQVPHGADFMISRLPMSGNVQPMSELVVTEHVVNLKRGNSKSLSSVYVQAMRKQNMVALEGVSRPSVSFLRRHEQLTLTDNAI